MLLSSIARAMYWGARYLERADALSRTIQGYERLSLDLPGVRSLDLRPLLGLVGPEASVTPLSPEDPSQQLRALVLDTHNPSSVLGALGQARENFRLGRVVTPPEAWAVLNSAFLQLTKLDSTRTADVFSALAEVSAAASRIDGELNRAMSRDAAFSFLRIGGCLERSDMLARSLRALLAKLGPSGDERKYDDVRTMGILRVLGAQTMYRRRHQARVDAASVLGFMVQELDSPLSLAHSLAAIDRELAGLPRALPVRAALLACCTAMNALGGASVRGFSEHSELMLDALAHFGTVFEASYFPEDAQARIGIPESVSPGPAVESDPFESLLREHQELDAALQLLGMLAERARQGHDVARDDVQSTVLFLSDFGALMHHEKEEMVLTPVLVESGCDWFEGSVAAMRREHRHESNLIRDLTQLASCASPWSTESRLQFADTARELKSFLRAHMAYERDQVFEPARHRLSTEAKARITARFAVIDQQLGEVVAGCRARLQAVSQKYLQLAGAPPVP